MSAMAHIEFVDETMRALKACRDAGLVSASDYQRFQAALLVKVM